jgi:hypothetical protein
MNYEAIVRDGGMQARKQGDKSKVGVLFLVSLLSPPAVVHCRHHRSWPSLFRRCLGEGEPAHQPTLPIPATSRRSSMDGLGPR